MSARSASTPITGVRFLTQMMATATTPRRPPNLSHSSETVPLIPRLLHGSSRSVTSDKRPKSQSWRSQRATFDQLRLCSRWSKPSRVTTMRDWRAWTGCGGRSTASWATSRPRRRRARHPDAGVAGSRAARARGQPGGPAAGRRGDGPAAAAGPGHRRPCRGVNGYFLPAKNSLIFSPLNLAPSTIVWPTPVNISLNPGPT